MPESTPAVFDREMGCTADELRAWLPGAAGDHPLTVRASEADIAIDAGRLHVTWQPLPPRRIALLTVPRLAVQFRFDGVGDEARSAFMRRFDLFTQRGGG
jgi:hypothetical protein